MLPLRSRNGLDRRAPSSMMRMKPPFSTTNRRLKSPGGAVRKSGKLIPVATVRSARRTGPGFVTPPCLPHALDAATAAIPSSFAAFDIFTFRYVKYANLVRDVVQDDEILVPLLVVGGVEGGLLAELLHLAGHVLQDELLRRREAAFAHGVGRGHEMELDAALLAFLLHDVAPLGHEGLGHVAGERVVDEMLDPHPGRFLDDAYPARRLVGPDHDVARPLHHVRVLVRVDEPEQDGGRR